MGFIQIVAITASATIFLIVIELIRRNHLKERYSLIWLAASMVLIIFSVMRQLLDLISRFFGIYYPPSFLFLLAIAFLLVLLLHLSSVVSAQSDQNKRLAQETGILRSRVDRLEKNSDRVPKKSE